MNISSIDGASGWDGTAVGVPLKSKSTIEVADSRVGDLVKTDGGCLKTGSGSGKTISTNSRSGWDGCGQIDVGNLKSLGECKNVRPLNAGGDNDGGIISSRVVLLESNSREDFNGGNDSQISSGEGTSSGENELNAKGGGGSSGDGSSAESGNRINSGDCNGSSKGGFSGGVILNETTSLDLGNGEISSVNVLAKIEGLGNWGVRVRARGVSSKGNLGEISSAAGRGFNDEDEFVVLDFRLSDNELSDTGGDKGSDSGESASFSSIHSANASGVS